MHIVFYSTSHVFEAEERLKEKGIDCKVVPTPVTDKAYCGVCIETYADNVEQLINDMEHSVVE
jgi:hypothetical protein